MCGIAGAIGVEDPLVIRRMVSAVRHRGPDQAGIFSSGRVHLGAARLSILDLNGGNQPLSSRDGARRIVFNGEIYNHATLRDELSRRGHVFRSRCDTEVVLHAFAEWGIHCTQHLSGMYAFAVLDGARVVLARDPLGIKPLYYSPLNRNAPLLFSSEIKGLLASGLIEPSIKQQALVDHAALGFLTGQETYFSDIVTFPPGEMMLIRAGANGLEIDRVPPRTRRRTTNRLSFSDAVDQLDASLSAAVESQMQADVPVSLTLSGGVDSALLAYYMRQSAEGQDIQCFTVADREDHPDIVGSKIIAHSIGAIHSVTRPTLLDAVSAVPRCISADEQPSSLEAHSLFFLFDAVSASFNVCLNGEGADELFCGYTDYLDPKFWIQRVASRAEKIRSAGLRASAFVEAAIDRITRLAASRADYLTAIFEFNLSDQLTRRHLEMLDRYAMASSVEARVPYLADAVVKLAEELPFEFKVDAHASDRKKLLMALARRKLPASFFAALPVRKIGLPVAGLEVAAAANAVLGRFGAIYNANHPLQPLLQATSSLLAYDLFEEIFMRHCGNVEPDFDTIDFFARRLDVAASELRSAFSEETPERHHVRVFDRG